jgi:hypothetical protein
MDEKQNGAFATVVNYASKIFSVFLSKDDMLSIYGAKKLLRSSRFVYDNTTAYLSEKNAAAFIFIAVNLAVLTYQYSFATWFMYFLTSVSGIKKLYKVIFKNPMLGLFFFGSFYFKVLEGTADETKFNAMAEMFGLPKHANFTGQTFMTSMVDNVPETVANYSISGYRNTIKGLLKTVAGIVVSGQVEGLGLKMEQILFLSFKNDPDIDDVSNAAVYISNRDIFTEADIQEYADFVDANIRKIKKDIKRKVGKNKRRRKLMLQRVVERRTKTGEIICLNECKRRIKTFMGCYCQGDCGKTFLIGKQSWCYVDPKKCKRGKQLPKYNGYAYDRCDAAKLTPPNCFTGTRWKECR